MTTTQTSFLPCIRLFSAGSQNIQSMLRDYEERNLERSSRTVKYGNILDTLVNEYLKGEKGNFDNYGAAPTNPEAYKEAVSFIALFPLDDLEYLPEVYLDPEGGIGFDWENKSGDSSFAVNFTGEGKIYFAGRFKNGDKFHGSGYFHGDEIPVRIIRSVFEVYK